VEWILALHEEIEALKETQSILTQSLIQEVPQSWSPTPDNLEQLESQLFSTYPSIRITSARPSPIGDGVTMSSRVINGVSADSVSVEEIGLHPVYGNLAHISFSINNDRIVSFGESGLYDREGKREGELYLNEYLSNEYIYPNYPDNFDSAIRNIENVYTVHIETRNYNSTNYISWGEWSKVDYDENPTPTCPNCLSVVDESQESGFFVFGGDPFIQDNLTKLTGSATYLGEIAIRVIGNNRNVNINSLTGVNTFKTGDIQADLTMNVNFDNEENLGSISGTIHNLQRDNLNLNVLGQINLHNSNIGDSHSGFFEGFVSGNINNTEFIGRHGGKFYGNSSSDNLPETVAGTFAATSTDGSYSISAPLIADKDN